MEITNEPVLKAIVIGASSDIGTALCNDWIEKSWEIVGTFRGRSEAVLQLEVGLKKLIHCDLASSLSVDESCEQINKEISGWNVLVLGPGLQEPIGLFSECDFDEWENSINVNFTQQLRVLHRLLASRDKQSESGPTVLFFAGGGVNDAPQRYSAYTVSKIALIKMVELLASEMPDVKFLIIGPGWVKTKIHNAILNAGELAGSSFERTLKKFEDGDFTPMSRVIDCCNFLIDGPRESLSGRNYSAVFDRWDKSNFVEDLTGNPNNYKLRRFGNNL